MRFTKIEGTTVGVHVTSAEEAKLALKELRHKKKELKFLRGALAKQVKASKPKRGKAKPAPPVTRMVVIALLPSAVA